VQVFNRFAFYRGNAFAPSAVVATGLVDLWRKIIGKTSRHQ
jgi:hypothetical protein